MSNSRNKPKSLRDLAEDIASRIDNPNKSNPDSGGAHRGRDVSNEPRVPKGQSDGGEWTAGGSSPAQRPSRKLANSHTPAPFVDDHGKPVLDKDGKPMLRPSDVDLRFFVDQGLAASKTGDLELMLMPLPHFWHGADWDIQRIGPDGQYVGAFRDAANVAIGLYGAAAGLPQSAVLEVANQAARFSNFAKNDPKTQNYTYLPERNIYDIKQGYALFQSGRIGPSK